MITTSKGEKVKTGFKKIFSDIDWNYGKPIVLTALTFIFLIWAKSIPYGEGPDEVMRYLIPKYIYQHGSLPTGYDRGAKYVLGNWSYAFYPQLLGGIVGAFFMKIGSIFSENKEVLLYFCRLTSVFFGLVTVAFVGKSIERITQKKNYAVFGMVLLGLLPQFTFLSSYVNNDIIAAAGTSIIIYALIDGVYSLWNVKNTLTLAVGIIVCGLGYLNSYGYILVGGLFFLVSNLLQIKQQRSTWKHFGKLFLLLFVLCTVVILPFFIRNYLLYGDFIGSSIFRKEYLKWVATHHKILQHPYTKPPTSGDFKSFIHDSTPVNFTKWSFIGLFGNMSILMDLNYYRFYETVFYVATGGIIITLLYHLVCLIFKKKSYTQITEKVLLVVFIGLGIVITYGLFVYYNLYIDFQPQGRYLISNLIPVILFSFFGLKRFTNLIKPLSNLLLLGFGSWYAIIHIYIYFTYIYNFYLSFKK